MIIEGVDVSGCDFLAKEDDYCSYSGEYRAYKGQCGLDEEMCKDHPNCFYKKALKQLKSKEQECERLKQVLTEIKEFAENNFYYLECDYRWTLEQILQKISECEAKDDKSNR